MTCISWQPIKCYYCSHAMVKSNVLEAYMSWTSLFWLYSSVMVFAVIASFAVIGEQYMFQYTYQHKWQGKHLLGNLTQHTPRGVCISRPAIKCDTRNWNIEVHLSFVQSFMRSFQWRNPKITLAPHFWHGEHYCGNHFFELMLKNLLSTCRHKEKTPNWLIIIRHVGL